jgi:phosphoribosyl 1,2-cyclic phosphate phosphodiesterase
VAVAGNRKTQLTILGCGTSGGVPRIGGDGGAGEWGACDPRNPRNRRRRCSVLVRVDGKTILVDTSPDVREQLLDAGVTCIDAVLWTHDHADQAHGIDDLRPFALRDGPVEGWADARTASVLRQRFAYCFDGEYGSFYRPIYRISIIESRPFRAAGIEVVPFNQSHGNIQSLGFRFGNIAYANDVVALDDAAFAVLEGVDTLVVDAMRYRPHPTHAHFDLALEWIERIRPRRAVLTNMHVDMDYDEVKRRSPPNVEPAYDGMVLEV